MFDIGRRLAQLDDTLFLCYEAKKKQYEVHSAKFRPTHLFTLPFAQLSARVLPYVAHRLHQTVEQAVREVELHNERLTQSRTQKVLDDASDELKDIVAFAASGGKDFIQKDKTLWV